MTTQQLHTAEGRVLAYDHTPGQTPGILFCAGFNSNRQGDKALALESWCRETGRQFTRFDYSGHGDSSGRFEEGTIGEWLGDTLAILDQVCEGPQLVVGSSMGGWIMLLVAMARPQRVVALMGIAAAPDFTEALWRRGLDERQRDQLADSGFCEIENCYDDGEPYRISRRLLEEGRDHLVMGAEIPVDVPIRLLHGQLDEDVPWEHALAIAGQVRSADAEVTLIKSGDHRLSHPQDLERLLRTVDALLEQIG